MEILYEKERKAFVIKARDVGGNTYMAKVDEGGFKSLGSGPCHGTFSNYHEGIKYAIWDSRDYRLNKDHKEYYDEWLLWFLNESCWAPFFVSKTIEEVHDYGFCMDASIPESSQGGQAMIASRFWTECHNSTGFNILRKNYIALRKAGLSVQDCFIFAFSYKFDGKGKFYLQPHNCGHTPFNIARYSESAWRHYFDNTFPKRSKGKTFQKYGGYSGGLGCQAALNDEKVLNSDAFYRRVQALRPASAEQKKDYHIFRKVSSDQIQYDQAGLLNVIEQLKGLL